MDTISRHSIIDEVHLKHLFICREYPPAAYPPGGIGTYVRHMANLLAEAGESVHVIAHRWAGAPKACEELIPGRLIVHRVAFDQVASHFSPRQAGSDPRVASGMIASTYPAQAFSWQAALLAEALIEQEGIDVIEAQEWEAPLYYLQLRRQLGLGPTRCPPCVVHLHSSTEQIFAANTWDRAVLDYAPAVSAEAFSILAADALIAPSQFMSAQTVTRYGIDPAKIAVIPYPLGNAPRLRRDAAVWAGRSICHVGRLEPRKGVLELADAVAAIAPDYPGLRVEFVGGDTPLAVDGGPTVGDAVRRRLSPQVRSRLHFHGSRDAAGVSLLLAGASAAIVPSRWENFPYSCIESMASGLPVVASPNGGMRELITDGVSGWIASDGSSQGLAEALTRALRCSAEERERMGAAAHAAVIRTCDNHRVVERHLQLKRSLLRNPAPRCEVPATEADDSTAGRTAATAMQTCADEATDAELGVVVTFRGGKAPLKAFLASLKAQSRAPIAVIVLCHAPSDEDLAMLRAEGLEVMCAPRAAVNAPELLAARTLLDARESLAAVAFVDARLQLDRDFLAVGSSAFARLPRLGVMGAWISVGPTGGRIHLPPDPLRPHLGRDAALAPAVFVESSALRAATRAAVEAGSAASCVDLLDQVIQSGWRALTYPAILGSISAEEFCQLSASAPARYSSMADALKRLHTPLWEWWRQRSPEQRRTLLRQALSTPSTSVLWLARRLLFRMRGSADNLRRSWSTTTSNGGKRRSDRG
ncbi:MAG: glycosyltransferase family 4 protein [Xanthomonadales bacterium]|nr:glycosyltransferase family 4 protein [Xanthomonadales bacterium]